jgi:hypothetical protein
MSETELTAILDSHPTTMVVHAEAEQARAV